MENMQIKKIHYDVEVDNPLPYLNLKNTSTRIINKIIDLVTIVGIDKWFISDQINYPIPAIWLTKLDRSEKVLFLDESRVPKQ